MSGIRRGVSGDATIESKEPYLLATTAEISAPTGTGASQHVLIPFVAYAGHM